MEEELLGLDEFDDEGDIDYFDYPDDDFFEELLDYEI